jgi:hypothetical protein
LNGLAIATAVAGVAIAFYSVTVYIAIPQNKELAMMRQQLTTQLRPDTSAIYFLRPDCRETAAPSIMSDFGQSSSCYDWAPVNATNLLLREIDPLRTDIPITQVSPTENVTPPPRAVVIDMRDLKRPLSQQK